MEGHPSRYWTERFISNLTRCLDDDWKINFKSKSYLHLTSPQRPDIWIYLMHYPLEIIGRDCITVSDVVNQIPGKNHIALCPNIWHEFQIDIDYPHDMPYKLYNCFIHRGCSFRQSWIYQLIRKKIIDQGFVTYWCEDRFDNRPPQEYFESLFQHNLIFQVEHEYLRDKIPFKNFNIPLEKAIMSSQRTLVIETFFDRNSHICYSEKIWRSLQMPRPWLMFNSLNAVKYLRDCGFDVLDEYVDHRYDCEPDLIKRQIMILDQLSSPMRYTQNILDDLECRASHNRNLLKSFSKQWPEQWKKILLKLADMAGDSGKNIKFAQS